MTWGRGTPAVIMGMAPIPPRGGRVGRAVAAAGVRSRLQPGPLGPSVPEPVQSPGPSVPEPAQSLGPSATEPTQSVPEQGWAARYVAAGGSCGGGDGLGVAGEQQQQLTAG